MDEYLNPDAVGQNYEDYDANEDNLVLDLENVDENVKFEALPPGVYNAVVDDTEYGRSNNGGNPMVTWKFKVVDAPYEKRTLFYHTVLTTDLGKAALKKAVIRICPDYPLSNLRTAADIKRFCEEGIAIGLPCRLKVKIRPYQGERRNNVTEVLASEIAGSFLDAQ